MRKITPLLVFISLLTPQFAPAAFAHNDDIEPASGRVRVFFAQAIGALKSGAVVGVQNNAVLSALLKAVKPSFTAPRRGEVRAAFDAPLTAADAATSISDVAEMLVGSLGALAGGFAVAAHEFSQVSRELVAADAVLPARQAQEVLATALPFLAGGFFGVPVRAVLDIPLTFTGRGVTLRSSDVSARPPAFTQFAVSMARAAESSREGWNEFSVAISRLINGFAQVRPAIERDFRTDAAARAYPRIAPLILRHIVNTDAALGAAQSATNAENADAALRAAEAAAGILGDMIVLGRNVGGEFRSALGEIAGATIYDAVAALVPQASYAALVARILQSGEFPSLPQKDIVSDPRELAYRAEQIGAEEAARKAAELRGKLKDVEAQLARDPGNAALLASAAELRGVIENLDRLIRAIPFAMREIKEPMLSCKSLDRQAMLRKVKAFAVAAEVVPLLDTYAKDMIREAETVIRSYYAGRIPKDFIDGIIQRAMDGSNVFQPEDERGNYGDDVYPYRPRAGRLRYDPREPNQVAGGIFSVAYGAGYFDFGSRDYIRAARVRQIFIVGVYMAEDALERFAADCTRPPSVVIREVMDKFAAYIAKTSLLSESGARDTLTEELEKLVQNYEDGLEQLLRDFDTIVYGGMATVLQNVATFNGSWTATAPDVTALLAAVKSALKALDELGFETAAWLESLEAAVRPQLGGADAGRPVSGKTLVLQCPTKSSKSSPPTKCEPERPVPEFYSVCKLFGLPGYSIDPHPRPVYTCANNNKIYAGRCCASPECTHPNPDLVWGTDGSPRAALDNYWNFIGIANSDESAARRVDRCTMNLATDPNKPFDQRPGCASLQATIDRGYEALCPWNLGAAPVPMDGPAANACPTGSAAEQERLITLMRQCVSSTAKDRVSLAFVWEQAKRYIKALVLEKLQGEMDILPKTITGDTQSILLGFLDDYTAKTLLKVQTWPRYDAVDRETVGAQIVKNDKMMRAAIVRLRFTASDLAPLWSGAAGPKVVALRMIADPYGGIPQHVFNKIFDALQRTLKPTADEIVEQNRLIAGRLLMRSNAAILKDFSIMSGFASDYWYADYAVAGAAAERSAIILNIAQQFDAYWENDGVTSKTLHKVLSDALKTTVEDSKLGKILPSIESIAARLNVPSAFGFNLHAFLDEYADPEKSPLGLKKFFAVATALDRVVDALKKLSEKDVEFSAAVTACASSIESAGDIGDVLSALGDALPEEMTDPSGQRARDNIKNMGEGIKSQTRVAQGEGNTTLMDETLKEIARRVAARLAAQQAAALRRE